MHNIIIRPYSKEDRASVRNLAYDTALLGDSADAFFDDRQIAEDFLTIFFIDYEPQSCFVAEAGGKIIGYLLGSKNISGLHREFGAKVIFSLLRKAITHGIIFKKKSQAFLMSCMRSYLKGEFNLPDFSREYPATLHINIKEEFRSQGIGKRLIAGYLELLAGQNIPGVHFATLSDRAAHFYDTLGFVLLDKRKKSYLRHVLHKDITCYVFGKKLTAEKPEVFA